MTIVDLSELDTFIRDSLYEVRRGIANSRNATQANPLAGVMVDLPEKIDFEISVTSGYQSLSRSVTSTDNNLSSETSSESRSTSTLSTDRGVEFGETRDALVSGENESNADSSAQQEHGSDGNSETSSGNENESGNQSSSESETTTSVDTSRETTTGTQTTSQTTTSSKSEEGNETSTKTNTSRQAEIHKEANDRASKTFDEDDGTWGQQGQISTPALPGGPACNC